MRKEWRRILMDQTKGREARSKQPKGWLRMARTIPSKDVSICRRVRVSSRVVSSRLARRRFGDHSSSKGISGGASILNGRWQGRSKDRRIPLLDRCTVPRSMLMHLNIPPPRDVPHANPLAIHCVNILEMRQCEEERSKHSRRHKKECVNRDRLHGMFVVQIKLRDKKPRS